ncbi:plant intracellular ras group-related LRR 3, partial [Prunus dulcis]
HACDTASLKPCQEKTQWDKNLDEGKRVQCGKIASNMPHITQNDGDGVELYLEKYDVRSNILPESLESVQRIILIKMLQYFRSISKNLVGLVMTHYIALTQLFIHLKGIASGDMLRALNNP